uniref:Uncharacterized protein n=1 Tax=Arundo donax TaxID=35708 RepID=A0A0A8YD23_ARUDO
MDFGSEPPHFLAIFVVGDPFFEIIIVDNRKTEFCERMVYSLAS